MNSILEKIKSLTPQAYLITEKIINTYTKNYTAFIFKYEIITSEHWEVLKKFESVNFAQKYTLRVLYTINGATDWSLLGLLKNYKKKRQTQAQFEDETYEMKEKVRDILSEITLELSEFYKDKTLPQNITIAVDVLTREATMTIDGVEQERFTLPPFETEITQ